MAQILDLGKLRFNWGGEYSPSTEYEYNDIVKYGANLYAYTSPTSTSGNVPTNTAFWTLATEGVRYRGTYTTGVIYYKNDLVTDDYSTFITLTQHTAVSDVTDVPELQIFAVGQQGLPSQSGKTGQYLTTTGTAPEWTGTISADSVYVGDGQGALALGFESDSNLTNTTGVFAAGADAFVQLAVANTENGASASTDVIAYTADGNNGYGWIDMGITSKTFEAAEFGITGPHDGYLFMSAPKVDFATITKKKVVAGVATLTTEFPHGYSAGRIVEVSGVGSGLDGRYTVIAAPTTTSFTFAVVAIDPFSEVQLDPFGESYSPVGNGDLVIATDGTGLENKIIFAAGGFATGRSQMTITPDQNIHIEIDTDSTSPSTGALTVNGGVGVQGDIYIAGDINIQGNMDLSGVQVAPIGTGAAAFAATLTNPTLVVQRDANDYAQIAFRNTSDAANASTDFIAYSDNGTDAAGYIDMGVTSSTFSDPDFTITGPNDGYLFAVAPVGTTGNGNLVLATGDAGAQNAIVFAAGGLADNNTQMTIFPNQKVHIEIATTSTSPTTGALTVVGGAGFSGDVHIGNNLHVLGNVNFEAADQITFGPGSAAFHETLTHPTLTITEDADDYAQVAFKNVNSGVNASTDFIAYADNGTDAAGYIDVGITSSTFADQDFTITGANDGYIFMVAPPGTTGHGNLVLATDGNGTQNRIVFAAGGLASNNTQMTIIPDTRVHIEIATASTSPTTGALTVAGGVGVLGDMNVQGNVSVQGTITFGGAGTTVETENLAVTDPMVYVGKDNAADIVDLAFIGEYKTGADTKYAGIARDASDGVIKFFEDATTKPVSTVDFSEAGLVYADVKFGAATIGGATTVAGTLSATGNISTNGKVTLLGTPSGDNDATTVAYVRTAIGGSWTEKTANYTLVAGEAIWANTVSGQPFTLTLPANPVANFDRIRIADIASTWGFTPVTLGRNGKLIQGLAEDLILNVKNASIELIYSGATYGWRLV